MRCRVVAFEVAWQHKVVIVVDMQAVRACKVDVEVAFGALVMFVLVVDMEPHSEVVAGRQRFDIVWQLLLVLFGGNALLLQQFD